MSERLKQFDETAASVTHERGKAYGHPSLDFDRASRLKAVVAECKDPLARHSLEMICVKLARLIQTPTHLDSWVDISGYARCGVMVTDRAVHAPQMYAPGDKCWHGIPWETCAICKAA